VSNIDSQGFLALVLVKVEVLVFLLR